MKSDLNLVEKSIQNVKGHNVKSEPLKLPEVKQRQKPGNF